MVKGSPITTELREEIRQGLRHTTGRGQRLDAEVQRRLELGLGADLSGVRVHTDEKADKLARVVGATAFTSGTDIFFRSGAYRPESTPGLYLLAHEAAHVLQQGYEPETQAPSRDGLIISEPYDPFEFAADRAAARVLLNIPADGDGSPCRVNPRSGGPRVVIQRHASWEHRLLGDAKPADLNAIAKRQSNWQQLLQVQLEFLKMWEKNPDISPEQIKQKNPNVRTLRLAKSGLVLTYGELNTLPDYMANPMVLDEQPREILLPILQVVRQEGYNRILRLLGHNGAMDFKDAVSSTWSWSFMNLIIETKAIDRLTQNIGPKQTNHYTALVARNACHFAPFSWYRWETFYCKARDLAKQAHDASDSNQKNKLTYEAWMNHGYADHFLQDSFAAGHLVNKTLLMQWFLEYAVSGWTGESWAEVFMADWGKIKHMTAALQPDLAARGLYNPSDPGTTRDPQTAEEQPTLPKRMYVSGVRAAGGKSQATAYQDYIAFLNSTVVQSASGVLHDHFNEKSLWVSSLANKTPYQLWGDDTMLNGGDGVKIASETAQMSQQSILEILGSGQSSITAQHIRDRFPSNAGSDGNSLLPLEQWNDSQKDLCMKDLFPEVHYYVLRALEPRIGHVSIDQK